MTNKQDLNKPALADTIRNQCKAIFVVGSSRSGTTLMSRIIGNHPKVFSFHEVHFFEQLWDGTEETITRSQAISLISRMMAKERTGYLTSTGSACFQKEAEVIVDTLSNMTAPSCYLAFLKAEVQKQGKEIPCEQTPRNIFYLQEIFTLVPESRIIVMIRDPRDVLLSQKRRWKRRFLGAKNIPLRGAVRDWFNYHPLIITRLWTAAIRAARKFQNDPRVHFVRFEDLANSPEHAVRELCTHLGIPFSPELLDVPQVGSSNRADSPRSLGIDPSVIGLWRQGGLSMTEIALCERMADPFMSSLNYSPEGHKGTWFAIMIQYFILPIKLGVAILLNAGRSKNFFSAVRRRLN